MKRTTTWTVPALAVFCAALSALPGPVRASRDFYLATDRIFQPDDPVVVQLEAINVSSLDVRVYRLEDPADFLAGLPDPHRPYVAQGDRSPSGPDLLAEGLRRSAGALYRGFRARLQDAGREAGREGFDDLIAPFKSRAYSTSSLDKVQPLKNLPLVTRFEERLPVTGGWVFRDINLPLYTPGAYLVEAVRGEQGAHTIVLVSRIALLTRQDPKGITVFVADAKSGKPVGGAQVRVLDKTTVLARGATNGDGLFFAAVQAPRTLVVAQHGADFAIHDPRYFPAMLQDRMVYLFTDRPVYRPGQTLYYKGISRTWTGSGYAPPADGTAEVSLVDPAGISLAPRKVTIEKGSFAGSFPLDSTARPGVYHLTARIDGKAYQGEFKVKAFKRPDFRVRVSTDQKAYQAGDTVTGTIHGGYFYGAPMAGAPVTLEVYRTRFHVPWYVDADFSWYYSESELFSTRKERITHTEGKLDQGGNFRFRFDTTPDVVDYTYVVEAFVTGQGGRALPGSRAIRVTRGAFRLAIDTDRLVIAPGSSANIRVEAVDYAGAPVDGVPITLRITARSTGSSGQPITHDFGDLTASTSSGVATFSVPFERRGLFTLEASATDKNGKTIQATGTLFVSDAGGGLEFVPGTLELVLDRRTYATGDTATVLALTPFAEGWILASVEGTTLDQARVVPVHDYCALFEVPITSALTPNFFVSASAVYDGHAFRDTRTVVVPPADRFLKVSVTADKSVYHPGEEGTFTFTVTDRGGKPVQAELAVSIVDAKIYAISKEMAIPIEQFFYPRRRNNVRSGSSLDFRFFGYARSLTGEEPGPPDSWRQSFGAAKTLTTKVRRKFVDTLAWQPKLKTDTQGVATLTVTFPDNLTEWRVTARAVTEDTRIGTGTLAVTSRQDLIVDVAAPWLLREQDRATVHVTARNLTGSPANVTLSLEAEGLELQGKPQQVSLEPNGSASAVYRVTAGSPGEATLTARAEGDLNDAMVTTIPVLPLGMVEVEAIAGDVPPSDGARQSLVTLTLPPTTRPGSGSISLRVSAGIASAMMGALDYLLEYPHGCVEQTMSRFLPDLVVARVVRDLGVKNPEIEAKLPGYIAAGTSRLALFQHADGGWGWWREDETDPYMTAHVMAGLALTRNLGYPVDDAMMQRGVARLGELARSTSLDPNTRAYVLYALALAGDPSRTMLERLAGTRALTPYGEALVALALSEAQATDLAQTLAQGLLEHADYDPDVDTIHWARTAGTTYRWEQDPIETTATVIRALLQAGLDASHAHKAVRWLMAQRRENHWASTKDTAAVILALADYVRKAPAGEREASVEAFINGKPVARHTLTAEDWTRADFVLVDQNRSVTLGKNLLRIDAGPGAGFFYSASARYVDQSENIKARSGAFQVSWYHQVLAQNQDGDFVPGRDIRRVKQGDLVLVTADVSPIKGAKNYVMVEVPIAGGLEVVDGDMRYHVRGVDMMVRGVHREVYDDRVVFFMEQMNQPVRLCYIARAVRPGTYHVPPAAASVMYRPELSGHSASRRLEVSR